MIDDIKHAVGNCFSVTWELNLRETLRATKATGDWSNALYDARRSKFANVTMAMRETWDSNDGGDQWNWYTYFQYTRNASGPSAMITSYNVTPLRKYAEISYRVKCVAVENERVFSDVYITHQTRDPVCQPDDYAFPSEYRRRRRNLIQRTLDGPDFMKLNSKRPTGSAGIAKSYWQRRSKSIGDEPSVITFNYENADNHDTVAKRPKVNVCTMLLELDQSILIRENQASDIDGFSLNRYLPVLVWECWLRH